MVKQKALLICNGTIRNYEFYRDLLQYTFIICVDGGTRHMRNFLQIPDIIIGDLDSTNSIDLKYYQDRKISIKKYSKQKDKTDTHLAVELAIELGYKEIIIIGCLGTRIDHTLANIQLLKYINELGSQGIIIDEYNEIHLVVDKINLKADQKYNLSLLPMTEMVTGINTKGLYYPLNNKTLKMGDSIGISNEFIDKEIKISIETGLLMLIKSRDKI